jgi:hypothetical protein
MGPLLAPDPQFAEDVLTPPESALVAEIRGNDAALA